MIWFFEIYTKSNTGVRGWDIKVGTVKAKTNEIAQSKIRGRFGARFDTFIQLHRMNHYRGGGTHIH